MQTRRLLGATSLVTASLLFTMRSDAAEPWVERPMTLRPLVFAGDVGLGIGHTHIRVGTFQNDDTINGVGMNLEGSFGVTEKLELGLRTGLRFGDDGKFTGADYYSRTLWTQTFDQGGDTVANPELRGRYVFYSGSIAEVGLDGRFVLPTAENSRFGMMFGVPLAFHVASFVRIDTGAYIPIVFTDRTFSALSIPGYFWFQVSPKLWLGPMAAVNFQISPRRDAVTHLLLGFGLGYQVASSVDLKTMLIFPSVDDSFERQFGVGFGVQFRIGE